MNNSPAAAMTRARRVFGALSAMLVALLIAAGLTANSASAAAPSGVVGGQAAIPQAPTPATPRPAGAPDLGPNVHILSPSMTTAQIQAVVDSVAAAQVNNQFGPRRDAILFMPGTYGSLDAPLNFQVGYYTEVAGLGRNPNDVVVNGSINVFNQCDASGTCIALNNFWRSLSNLTINVVPGKSAQYSGCYGSEFWAVSQAAPMRRVQVNSGGKNVTLQDYCSQPGFASGGFIADSRTDASLINAGQQQFYVRNSAIGGWSNSVWNQVFSGTTGAPAQDFGGPNYYTTLTATPASREKPYLYVDGNGAWQVFVPDAAKNSNGPTWSATTNTPGRSVPLTQFYIARPGDSAVALNVALATGRNVLLTPGVYSVLLTAEVTRPNTVILGLGYATLTSATPFPTIRVEDVGGVDIAGVIFDAGSWNSSVLLQIGSRPHARPVFGPGSGPTALQDVFFRIGGPHAGRADTSLIVNTDDVILDDIWAWRADHGTGVGWNKNTASTGLIVNGDRVTATGLFVEHYQKYEVMWNGQDGTVVFFQNEMPYDVPSQKSWMSDPNTEGYAAFKIALTVQRFAGYGMGSYSFFNQGVDIVAAHAFETPKTAGVRFHDLLSIFLDATNGQGGIRNVINNVGGSSTAANPDIPVTVVDYPA